MAREAESKAWIVFLAFPLLLLLCEAFGLSVAQSSVNMYVLESRGKITDGTAFFTEYRPCSKTGGAYYVLYMFDYNGTRYKGDWRTSVRWVHDTKLPATIRVQFLPDNPARSWPPDVGVRAPLLLKLLFLLFCLVGVAYFATRVLSAWHRSGKRWSPLAVALTAASWPLIALGVFDIAPLLTVLLALGCVAVAAGFGLDAYPGAEGSHS